MNKRICIVGGGWYGCHVANYILTTKRSVELTIIDKCDIFSGASSKNQNRLHLGFHYPRSDDTIQECKAGYYKFLRNYSAFVDHFSNNFYFIDNYSKVKLDDYVKKFEGSYNYISDISELDFIINNVNGKCINVGEGLINNFKASLYFKEKFKDILVIGEIKDINVNDDYVNINGISYDYVINCTNNTWQPIHFPYKCIYQTFCSFIYKIDFKNTTSITVMDGEFFSIYPYNISESLYTVTHVKYGILHTSDNFEEFKIEDSIIDETRKNTEMDIIKYIPEITNTWEYIGYFVSYKSKYDTINDDRSLRAFRYGRYVSFSGGKITGIFETESIIDSLNL